MKQVILDLALLRDWAVRRHFVLAAARHGKHMFVVDPRFRLIKAIRSSCRGTHKSGARPHGKNPASP